VLGSTTASTPRAQLKRLMAGGSEKTLSLSGRAINKLVSYNLRNTHHPMYLEHIRMKLMNGTSANFHAHIGSVNGSNTAAANKRIVIL
jgi:hypothetical protein